jgi:hypothetical protein
VLANEKSRWQTERTQLERRLSQRDAELAALRSRGGQTSPMTEVLDAITSTDDPKDLLAQAKCIELQEKLDSAQSENETLRRLIGESTIIQGRFEKLTRDFDKKCIDFDKKCSELDEARAQLTAAASATSTANSGASIEAKQRDEALTRWQAELATREERLAASQQQIAAEREAATAETRQLAADRQQLDEARRQLQTERDEILDQRRQTETERQELAAQAVDLARQRSAIAAERDKLADNQADGQKFQERERQLAQRASQLEEQAAAVNVRLTEADQLREQLKQERAALEERGQQLDQLQQEIDAKSEALEQKLNQLEALQQQVAMRAGGGGAGEEVHLQEAPVAAEPAAAKPGMAAEEPPVSMTTAWRPPEPEKPSRVTDPYASRVSQAISQHLSLMEKAQSQTQKPAEGGNVDDVLSRLVQSGVWRGEQSPPAPPAPAAPPAAAPARTPQPAPAQAEQPAPVEAPPAAPQSSEKPAEHDDEESIESYMDRLLKRVRGDSPKAAEPTKTATPAEVILAEEEPPQGQTEQKPEDAEQSSPRRPAPETTNISAMRDLANTAARSAIDRHVRKNTSKQAAGRLFSAFLTVAASVLLGYWAWKALSLQAAVGAGIGGFAGMYWVLAALRRIFSVMRLNKAGGDEVEPQAPAK